MGTDDKIVLAIVETVRLRCEVRVGEVDTPVGGEGDIVQIFETAVDIVDAFHALRVCHLAPFEVQVRTLRMLGDDILASDIVAGISAPVQDPGDGDACFPLDFSLLTQFYLCLCIFKLREEIIRYLTVATSDAVVSETGPAILNGSFATVRRPFSSVNTKTRFEPPSIFSQLVMLLALQRERILWHSALKSKLMWRSWSWVFSLRSQRPLV
jgi:hypothetical protein